MEKFDFSDNPEENILYEIVILSEWVLDHEEMSGDCVSRGGSIFYRALKQTPKNLLLLAAHLGNSYLWRTSVSPELYKLLTAVSGWQFSVGPQGLLLAILQDATLEIRSKKDDFSANVGKNLSLYIDPYPKWRKVAWSAECSMVAVGYSNGVVEVFSTIGVSLFSIYPQKFLDDKVHVDTSNALVTLVFSDVRTEKNKWAAELIMIDFNGNIRGYFVSPTEGYQESHSSSFHKVYPWGVTAASVHGSLVCLAGTCQYTSDSNLHNNGLSFGITVWRMLNEYPHYKQMPTIDEERYIPPKLIMLRHIPFLDFSPHCDHIFRLSISPSGRDVAAVHVSGALSLWEFPSLRKRKFWPMQSQPNFKCDSKSKNVSASLGCHPVMDNQIMDIKWWSDKAFALVRCSGALTVCSTDTLHNYLGDTPEFFEGVPQISENFDRSLLILELERTALKTYSRSLLSSSESLEGAESVEDTEVFEVLSWSQKARLLFLNILFWITDAERFRPKNLSPKVLSKVYRLLSLKSTSPVELFTRKIENDEYEEALSLAKKYSLDTDMVYQQQWKESPVTSTSIQECLTKVRKRSWVLNECLTRVPEDLEAARELILYGLRGTDLDTLVAIQEGDNKDGFLVSDLTLEYEEDPDMDPETAAKEAEEWASRDLKQRRELLAKIDFMNLSHEQIEVVKARQTLLRYYDRLNSYELILGGSHVLTERYDPTFYEKFRTQSEIEAAARLSRNGHLQGLEVMFTYYGPTLRAHKLPILSNLPPTIGPYEYKYLLPECDLSGNVFEWEEEDFRDSDWSEDRICREAVGIDFDPGFDLLYKDNPSLDKFKCDKLSVDIVSEWYVARSKEMEDSSRFVDAALDLLKLGREKNVPGLEEIQEVFDTLEVLIYEVGLSDLVLREFEPLSDLEKLKLLLSTSTSETLIQNIRRWGQPFLNHLDRKNLGYGQRLLREFIVSSSILSLNTLLKTIQHSQPDMTDPILCSNVDVLRVALESIYSCENEAEILKAFAVLECLPQRNQKFDSKEVTELHNRVDVLEEHLSVVNQLSSYGVNVLPAYIRDIRGDDKAARMLFVKLARSTSMREIKLSTDDWNKLLNDLLEMQQKVFSVLDPHDCFEIMTEALLTSGSVDYIHFAGDLMETSIDWSPQRNPYLQKIPYCKAVKMVLKASQEYFNSSQNFWDSDMELARICLRLIKSENIEIKNELNLISSLEFLPDLQINILPLQVRLKEQRLDLISDALERNPELYRNGTIVILAGHLLEGASPIEGLDDVSRIREGRVITWIAEAALKHGDIDVACHWCSRLMSEGHSVGWEVCTSLGRREDVSSNSRKSLLDFALTCAPPQFLEEILEVRNELELMILYDLVNNRLGPSKELLNEQQDVLNTSPEESAYTSCDESLEPSESGSKVEPLKSRTIMNVTKDVFTVTAKSTSSLLSSVTNKKLWTDAAGWLQPLKDFVHTNYDTDAAEVDGNSEFCRQGCHAFYADIVPHSHISQLGPSYRGYSWPLNCGDPALEVSLALFRTGLVESSLNRNEDTPFNDTVLKEIIKGVIKEDLVLGFCFLQLLSNEPHQIYEVLTSLPKSEICLQACLYFYGLEILASLHSSAEKNFSINKSDILSTGIGLPDFYLKAPFDIINEVRLLGKDDLDDFENETVMFFEYFKNTDKILQEYQQGETLDGFDAGIDIDRFLVDVDYKMDTVLGLAMTSDEEVLKKTILLAKTYGISILDVYIGHIQYLFEFESDANVVKEALKKEDLMKTIKSDKNTNYIPKLESILDTIDGRDHERLLLYFGFLSEVVFDEKKKEVAERQRQMVAEVASTVPSLDYKLLTDTSSNALQQLIDLLNHNNVDQIAELWRKINGKEGKSTSSAVYKAWAQKLFIEYFKKTPSKKSKEWTNRLKKLVSLYDKMSPVDTQDLVQRLAFTDDVADVPLEARKELIKMSITQVDRIKGYKEESGVVDEWLKVLDRLKVFEEHCDRLRSEVFQDLYKGSDQLLKSYAHRFMLTGGIVEALEDLSQKVLVEGCSIEALRSILSLYPEEHESLPEDVFMSVFRSTLEELSRGTEERSESLCSVLSHLLKELKSYCDEGGALLDEFEILEDIRSFSSTESNPLTLRIRSLSIAKEYLDLSEEDLSLLRAMKTDGIVGDVFSSGSVDSGGHNAPALSHDKLDSEEARLGLLDKLINEMDSVKKAESAVQLLNIWPEFQKELYGDELTNPWMKIFIKLLATGEKGSKLQRTQMFDFIFQTIPNCCSAGQLPTDSMSCLITKILDSGFEGCLKTASKVALKTPSSSGSSGEDSRLNGIFERYKNLSKLEECDFDDELFELLIEREKVTNIVSSILFGQLMTYLTENPNKEESIKSVVNELHSSGYLIEASSVALLCSSIPQTLKTANAAIKMVRKWL